MKQSNRPVLLIILDGFGYAQDQTHSAITTKTAPFWYSLWDKYAHTTLAASGIAVGLPPGCIGNSEVGHLTIGSGAIIQQPLTIINDMIRSGELFKNQILMDHLRILAATKKQLHIIGIVSDAGVHGHLDHLVAYIKAAQLAGVGKIIVHAILDGRDVDPRSAKDFLIKLDTHLSGTVILGSLQGRFYAMDRDNNWERTEESYQLLTDDAIPVIFDSWRQAIDHYYSRDITDEFIPPIRLHKNALVQKDDAVIITNIRPERITQLTSALVDESFNKFARIFIPLSFCITPVPYGSHLATISLISNPIVQHCLKELLAQQHKKIFTIAETEKWAHLTYFFDGYRDTIFPGEMRIAIPSIKRKTYVEDPCMSAVSITDALVHSLNTDPYDFYLINYANADMVAHSGNMEATQKAVACLDSELERLYCIAVKECDGTMIVTADHGNAECMVNTATGFAKTAHTANDVPFLVISSQSFNQQLLADMHTLADIKQFVLSII
jgi:2,3-bisphosphoglycerate-independent phosphoglycerate mutase